MLYREDGQYKLMPLKALFNQRGEEHESYVVDKKEMEAYEEMGHISNLSFEEANYSQSQMDRLSEVANFPEKDYAEVIEYVAGGSIRKGSAMEREKEVQALKEALDTLVLDNLMGGF